MEKEENKSSIKSRQKKDPMSDLTEMDNVDDKPSSRRVSFASSNFIKVFSIDPEKNTIWDNTYEEMINSDSTHSSENAHGTLSVQQTRIPSVLHCDSKEGESIGPLISNLKRDDLTLDNEVLNKENVGIARKSRKSVLTTSAQKSIPLQKSKQNVTILNEVNMEISEELIAINETNYECLSDRTCTTEAIMECTQFVPKENLHCMLNSNQTITANTSLEYTCQIPVIEVTSYLNYGTTDSSDNMELTQGVCVNKLIDNGIISTGVTFKKTSPVKVERHLQKSSFETKNLLDLNNGRDVFQNTVAEIAEMDLTTPVTLNNINFTNEFCQNEQHRNGSSRITRQSKKTNVVDENTVQMPNINIPDVDPNETIDSCKSMELTHAISINKISERNNVTIFTHVNLEETLPVSNKVFDKTNLQKQLLHLNNSKAECKLFQNTVAGTTEMDLTPTINIIASNKSRTNSPDDKVQNSNSHHNIVLDTRNMTTMKQNNKLTNVDENTAIKSDENKEVPLTFRKTRSQTNNATTNIDDKNMRKRVLHNRSILKTSKDKEHSITYQEEKNTPPTLYNNIDIADLKSTSQEGLSVSKVVEEPPKNSSNITLESTEQSYKDKLPTSKNPSDMNCLSLSLCTDDTDQLINYNLSNQQLKSDFSKIITGDLNPSFINSKIMVLNSFNSDVFPVSLENTQEVIASNRSYGLQPTYLVSTNTNKRNSSENISLTEKDCLNKSEDLRISQESILLNDSIVSNNSNSFIQTATQDIIANITNDVKTSLDNDHSIRNNELWQNFLKNNQSMESVFEEFNKKMENLYDEARSNVRHFKEQCTVEVQAITKTLKKWNVEEIDSDFSNSSSFNDPTTSNNTQDSLHCQTNIDSTLNLEKTLTFEEQIEKKYYRSKKYLRIISMENNLCKLDTLFKTIKIDVHFTKDNGIVNKIDVHSKIADDSESVALLLHKRFLERLIEKNIHSAVGEKYDILSFLDYVHLNMQKALDILKEFHGFEIKYRCEMDKTFWANFYIINLINSWRISVDMSDLDNISENSMKFEALVGTINEYEIRKFVNKNYRGLIFLRNFLSDVKSHAHSLMQKHFF